MFYSSDAAGLRKFLAEKLGLQGTDVGEGWMIFDLPEADMGCHPADENAADGAPSGTANISFYCDDIEVSVQTMKGRGVQFKGPIEDRGFGLVTHFRVPGNFWIQLFESKY